RCPNATIDGIVVYSNNPPCGAMRGFGSVQNCYAHEAQMDRLAAALGMDPVELRIHNALETGSEMITGQKIDGPVPVAELLRRVRAFPLPVRGEGQGEGRPEQDPTSMPGGVSNTTHGEGVKRGVGYAAGFKNIGYSEGFSDYSTPRASLTRAEALASTPSPASPLPTCGRRSPRIGPWSMSTARSPWSWSPSSPRRRMWAGRPTRSPGRGSWRAGPRGGSAWP